MLEIVDNIPGIILDDWRVCEVAKAMSSPNVAYHNFVYFRLNSRIFNIGPHLILPDFIAAPLLVPRIN